LFSNLSIGLFSDPFQTDEDDEYLPSSTDSDANERNVDAVSTGLVTEAEVHAVHISRA